MFSLWEILEGFETEQNLVILFSHLHCIELAERVCVQCTTFNVAFSVGISRVNTYQRRLLFVGRQMGLM